MNDMISALAQFVAGTILKQPRRALRPDETLISSGLIDSFSLVDLAAFVEDRFSVHLDDTELSAESFDTLQQLAALIAARQ